MTAWLAVPGFEGQYEVSDDGDVRSLDRVVSDRAGRQHRTTARVLVQEVAAKRGGYLVVTLCRDGRRHRYKVHTLVLSAFVGPRPPGCEGLHWDGDPTNNARRNLRWGTRAENNADTVRHGRHAGQQLERCPLEHPLAAPNLVPSRTARICLSCSRGRSNARRRREFTRVRDYADAHFAQLTGDRGAALRALGVTPRRLKGVAA